MNELYISQIDEIINNCIYKNYNFNDIYSLLKDDKIIVYSLELKNIDLKTWLKINYIDKININLISNLYQELNEVYLNNGCINEIIQKQINKIWVEIENLQCEIKEK